MRLHGSLPTCDMGLVIAPDHLLAKFTLPVEQYSHNLGCGSMNAALCANKVTTEKLLKSHGIPVPADAAERPACGKTGGRVRCAGRAAHHGCPRYRENSHRSISRGSTTRSALS